VRQAAAQRNKAEMPTTAPSLSARGFDVPRPAKSDQRRQSGSVAAQRNSRLAERKLLRAARRGDTAAQEELFRRHWRPMHRAAYLIVQDAVTAEDVAQEAFLAAIGALDRFDFRRPLGPWLHRIAVNRAIDVVRARELRREVGGETVEGLGRDEGSDPPDGPAPEGAPLTDQLAAAVAALPVEQRAVVVMRYLLDYTPGEIARSLDLPRGTVNSRLRRGLDRLAARLEPEEET
jgi:RNA polymerase sigma-70 factor (ECF subfamily)